MTNIGRVFIPASLAAVVWAAEAGAPAEAAYHLWKVQEVFTNYDGSVQFVELITNFDGQNFLAGHTLTATSDGSAVVYTMPSNIVSNDAQDTLLLATAGFGALTGGVAVAPDYPTVPLPNKFFDPNAASITLNFSGFDSITFAGSAIPKDGITSLYDINLTVGQTLILGVNSPKNSTGQSGFVNVPPAADFNEDRSVNGADLQLWQMGFGLSGAATHMQGDANGDLDVDGGDFLLWQQQNIIVHQVPVTAPIPEPRGVALLALAGGWVAWRRNRNGVILADRRRKGRESFATGSTIRRETS